MATPWTSNDRSRLHGIRRPACITSISLSEQLCARVCSAPVRVMRAPEGDVHPYRLTMLTANVAELQIEFCDVKMRYRQGLPLVLKGLTVTIPAGSKAGVVGRTGTAARYCSTLCCSNLLCIRKQLELPYSAPHEVMNADLCAQALCCVDSRFLTCDQTDRLLAVPSYLRGVQVDRAFASVGRRCRQELADQQPVPADGAGLWIHPHRRPGHQ